MRPRHVVGTHDTKGEELAFLAGLVPAQGLPVVRVDVGTRQATSDVDVTAAKVAAFHPSGAKAVLDLDDRGSAVGAMAESFSRFIATREDLGGSSASGAAAALRSSLPVCASCRTACRS